MNSAEITYVIASMRLPSTYPPLRAHQPPAGRTVRYHPGATFSLFFHLGNPSPCARNDHFPTGGEAVALRVREDRRRDRV